MDSSPCPDKGFSLSDEKKSCVRFLRKTNEMAVNQFDSILINPGLMVGEKN